jgi:hypothetical protein
MKGCEDSAPRFFEFFPKQLIEEGNAEVEKNVICK